MRKHGYPAIWRSLEGRKYRIADFISAMAEEIRSADRTKDLSWPISRLLMLTSGVQKIRYEMLERELKLDPKARNLWPRL